MLTYLLAWFAGSIALGLLIGRCIPPATNTSRAIRQFEQQRRYQGTNGDWPAIPSAFHVANYADEGVRHNVQS